MGRLVELNSQKKKETSSKTSAGRLVTIGDTSKIGAYTGTKFGPVERKAPISGASPAKTTANTDAWTRATPSQTRIPEKAGSIAQGTTANAREFSGSSRKIDKPTFAERVGKTISGGAKSSAAAYTNVGGTMAEGSGYLNTMIANNNAGNEQMSAIQGIKDYNAMLESGKWADGKPLTEDDRKKIQTYIAANQRKIDAHRNYTQFVEKSDKEVADKAYQKADALAASAEKDLNRAKEGAGAVGRLLVDAGASMTQTGLDAIPSILTGGATGMVPFAVRAFGGAAQQARQDGADFTGQLLYGGASAAKEVFTEKMFNIALPFAKAYGGGALDDVVERGIRSAVEKFAKTDAGKKALGSALTFGAGAVGEGLEEFIGDWMEWQLPRIYGGDVATAQENFSNSLYDFLVGATSGAMGGVISPNTYHYDLNTQQATQQNTPAAPQQAAQERTNVQEGNVAVPIQNAVQSQQEAVQRSTPQRNTTFTQAPEQAIRQREAAVQDSFERTAKSLGENGQKAFRAAYTEGADRSDYAGEFLRAYHAGLTGQENPNSGSAVSFAGYTAAQRDAAASLAEGKRAAQFAKTAGTDSGLVYDSYVSQEMNSAVADEINTVAKALGVRVQMKDQVLNGQANGQISGSDILIAKDAADPVLQVVGHEWTHRVQELAPEQYRAFRGAVTSMPDVQEAANILFDQYNRAGVEISYERALDEATANYAGELIQNSDVLDDFIRRHGSDRTMLQKLRDAIHEIVGKLTGRAKRQAQTVEGKLQAAFEAASRQAKTLQAEGGNDTMGTTRYSAKASRGRTIELETMENNRFQRLRQFGENLPAEWYAYTNEYFYVYSNQSYTDYSVLAKAKINEKNRADIREFMEALEDGTVDGAEAFNNWASDFRRGKGRYSWHRVNASESGTVRRYDGMDVPERGGENNRSSEKGNRVGENVKFSLKTPVEETDKLIAVHNKDEDSILSALKLGGLPMPSIAVVKAKAGHSKYGPISLLFNKTAIDPQADSRNKVYGGDAYTPTNPGVEYPVNAKAARNAEKSIYDLSRNVADGIFAKSSILGRHGIEDVSRNSLAKTAENLANDDAVLAAYLAAQGKTLEPVYQGKVWDSKVGNDTLKTVVDKIGVQRLAEINADFELGESAETALGKDADILRDVMREHYRELGEPLLQKMAKKHGWSPEEISEKRNARIERSMESGVTPFTLENLARHAWEMYQDGGATAVEIDRMGTREKLRELTDGENVKGWIEKQLDGVLGEPGINNGKDPYTSSGNRRSFNQTHYSYTLENIVKAMQETQEERGGQVSGVTAGGLQAIAAPSYRTIQEIRDDSGRLGSVEADSYKAQMGAVEDQIRAVTQRIMQTTKAHSDNSFEEGEIIGTVLMEAAKGKRTIDSIMRTFAKEGYKISNVTAKQIQELYKAAAALPTEYFEAKPQRAVGFDEVLAAVIPDNSSDRLKNALQDAGVNMVEYVAGDETDRLAKVNSVDDAQFSLKGTENAQELAALKRENDTLKERVAYWKSQTRRTQQVTTDKKSVSKAADALVKDYGASIKGSEIAGDLQSLYDYIASGKDGKDELTYTEARRRSDAIAEKIAESAVAKDDQTYQDYADLRKSLKDTKLTLTAQDAAEITDFNELRKSQFGKVKLGTGEHTNVDQVYSELAEQYPEFFSEQRDMNISDQVQRIADVADMLYTVTKYNPFEGYMGQAVASISNDIMDRFFDLPQTKKTFADRQAEQLQATRAAGKQAAQDAFLAGQMAQGRQDAKRLRSTAQALAKERTRRAEQMQAMRERYREKDVTRRESQKIRELRAKIIRHADAMSRKLLRPTDTQHIPQEMRSAVAAVLNSINRESKYTLDENGRHVYDGSGTPTKREAAFKELKKQYQAITEESDMVVDPSLLGDDGSFEQVIDMGDTRLADLSREQLQTMWNVLRSVEHSVSTAGKTLATEKFVTTRQFADSLKTDTMTRRRKLGGNVSISLETPYTFFAHFGQTGKDIYRMLRNAQDRQEIMARDVTEKVQQVLGDTEKAGLRGNAVTAMNEKTHHFTTGEGKDLTLTTAQAMDIYLLSERQQAQDHLLKGGIVQPEIKIPGQKKIPRGTEFLHLTAEDIQNIVKVLTPEQIRIADGLQKLTTGILAEYGNEASMKAYGYKKFTEKDYWPIKSTKEALHSTTEKSEENTRSIKNIGMAQAVKPNANTALEVRSVFDTFADHASDMIDYAAWLCPMEDVNRLYNFQFRDSEGNLTRTVKDILEDKGGQGSQQYWNKLMGDIQNGIKAKDFEPLTDQFAKGIGSFKGAAVGANVRVVIQQPTAFFRASAVLDPADMAKGVTGGVTKGSGWEKAVKYSPIAMRKDVGSFDISSPYTLNDRFYGKEGVINKVNEAAGKPAGAADAITWGALWNACEWQVKREQPNLRAGSNEFYSAVNDVFTDMIDQTQVVDGILQRSNIMRGKSDLAKQATSFMGEPIMSLNVFMRAWDNMRYEENPAKRSKAIKGVGRAAAALLVTNVVNAMAQSIADAGRDDDEDKDYWEKYMTALTGITGDEKTMQEVLTNVLLEGNLGSNNNPVGNIPFLKDILSLAQGYSVSRTDMQVFSDIVSASKTFIDSIGGNGKKTRTEAMTGMFAACSKLFGLPVSNIKRDVTATINTAIQATRNVAMQYEWDKLTYNISNTANKNRYLGLMFKALEQGDLTTYEHIRKELKDYMAVDSTTADNSMRTRLENKQKEDEDYRLPKESAALIGAKTRYDDSKSEGKFDENDLSSDDYIVYSRKKAETYSSMEAGLTGSAAFQKFSADQKDKALSSLETYAKKTALQSVAGSDYEITDRWILNAQEAEKKYGIKPEVYIALKTQVSGIESVKDRSGEAIPNSKSLLIMQAIYNTPGLSEAQRNALFEYMGVGKSIRHFNKTLVNEKVRQNEKKAGK